MNDKFSKDISKHLSKSDLGGAKELPAGVTPRRYEPATGLKRHNERIHRESKVMDKHGNLPFTFSKPKKEAASKLVACVNCNYTTVATKNTIGIICPQCKQFSKVVGVDND